MVDRLQPRQRGAALLTAMVIVTLVATMASAMVWQQWRAVRVEGAERARMQAAWILGGALDWARLILREDANTQQPYDTLDEPWATPLQETPLSTFLAVDKDNTGDAPEAFLSGSITDAQARYNLNNLIESGEQLKLAAAEVEALRRLCREAGVGPDVADAIANGLLAAFASKGDNPALDPASVAQLGWLGVDAETLRRLTPLVVLLPGRTPVNLNTASKEVIAGATGLDTGDVERLLQTRERTPFKTLEEAKKVLPPAVQPKLVPAQAGVATQFFEVRGQLRLADRVLQERSLVQRSGKDVFVRQRERISLNDAGS